MQDQNPKPCYGLWEFYATQVSKVSRTFMFYFVLILPLPKKAKFILLFQSNFFLH